MRRGWAATDSTGWTMDANTERMRNGPAADARRARVQWASRGLAAVEAASPSAAASLEQLRVRTAFSLDQIARVAIRWAAIADNIDRETGEPLSRTEAVRAAIAILGAALSDEGF